jgi:phage terminase large subunit-like protein
MWIPADRWDACRVLAVSSANTDMACAVGFDMSEKLDLTAGVVALRVEDDRDAPADTVELLDNIDGQEVKKSLNLNFSVELIPFFWLPEETLRERVTKERVPFDAWARNGDLRVTPGPVIDHDLIYEQFTTDIGKRYKPQQVGYDAHNATQFAVALRDKGKYTVVDVPQGRALSESFKLFEALVRLKRIRHAGNAVLSWCVSNAEPKHDRYENLWCEKSSPMKRIDGVIAAVIALSRLVTLSARQRVRRRAPSIWTPEGFRPIVSEGEGAHV